MFCERVIKYNTSLHFSGRLPKGIRIMNPFRESKNVLVTSSLFYEKFYNDDRPRKLILGINPGRHGAGVTGIPFTDTKRLSAICGIRLEDVSTHEPSSVFIYDLIEKYGGPSKFYADFFINSICPLGFVRKNEKGNWVNCNYYDYPVLVKAVRPYMTSNLLKLVELGIDTSHCYVLGKKNARYVKEINDELGIFREIHVLEHPRYIEQYKSLKRQEYIAAYLKTLKCAE
jgi:hypothetical protein